MVFQASPIAPQTGLRGRFPDDMYAGCTRRVSGARTGGYIAPKKRLMASVSSEKAQRALILPSRK